MRWQVIVVRGDLRVFCEKAQCFQLAATAGCCHSVSGGTFSSRHLLSVHACCAIHVQPKRVVSDFPRSVQAYGLSVHGRHASRSSVQTFVVCAFAGNIA